MNKIADGVYGMNFIDPYAKNRLGKTVLQEAFNKAMSSVPKEHRAAVEKILFVRLECLMD